MVSRSVRFQLCLLLLGGSCGLHTPLSAMPRTKAVPGIAAQIADVRPADSSAAARSLSPKTAQHEPLFTYVGKYFCGDGLGFNQSLEIKFDGHYEYALQGCLGKYSKHIGRIKLEENGSVVLDGKGLAEPKILKPIRWGSRLYLMEPSHYLEFCNDINEKLEPRKDEHGSAFLRAGDEKKVVSGLPEVPTEWLNHLLKHRVEGKIIQVFGQTATINVGSLSGLRPGMRLTAWGRNGTEVTMLRVKSTTPSLSTVELEGMNMLAPEERNLLWRVDTGQTVTSGFEPPNASSRY